MFWKCLEWITWATSLRSKARQGNRLSSKFDLCQSPLSQNLSSLTSVQNVLLGWGVFFWPCAFSWKDYSNECCIHKKINTWITPCWSRNFSLIRLVKTEFFRRILKTIIFHEKVNIRPITEVSTMCMKKGGTGTHMVQVRLATWTTYSN